MVEEEEFIGTEKVVLELIYGILVNLDMDFSRFA